ncbi:MAG: DUF4388 domain-containing protein [Myxococcales bacterium]|nr:DUF4388 domain-containing protein [Myxococcales bacterium]
MSLVGSLEDLGLGDILQIVSMARKSGMLVLRSDAGEGRIVFCDGMVRAAFAKGEPDDLRGLLVGGGFLSEADFDLAAEAARSSGRSLDEAIAEHTALSAERLASLRREHVERAVVRMFTWRAGEFSFDVREDLDARDAELLLPQGLNTQYLAMEAMRLGDESLRDDEADAGRAQDPAAADDGAFPDALALAALERAESAASETEAAAPEAHGRPVAGLIAIDPELDALEWMKTALTGLFPRVHIFQRCESGIDRIRQYLARGELPVVLLSAQATADSAVAANNLGELLARLRAQAPTMPILVIHEEAEEEPRNVGAADSVLTRPTTGRLVARRAARKREEAAQRLREALQPWAARASQPEPGRSPTDDPAASTSQSEPAESPGPLEVASPGMETPTRGDVLSRVLEYAAQVFSRVAIFMYKDDGIVGIAQSGLARAGGPEDGPFRELRLDCVEPSWFRTVFETRKATRSVPCEEADFQLVQRLGTAAPSEVYVAPIEIGGRVVALLYADNLPNATSLGDTSALEVVIHEASQALDRAVFERTEGDLEGEPPKGAEGP